ncbi:YfiH family protein [Arcanobacterium pluranimalium]|uniref:polyphenol oxidase family protein n=1 Tax=Arcanobacterium pluranimalium TaxID=108028 RepID=UPI001958D9F6|nr:polyphenol oxidase family protein [Arcanobacterium pluranimalium]MBM7825590.1 YfiH family protein [Arcanobacterium pluranimalium]
MRSELPPYEAIDLPWLAKAGVRCGFTTRYGGVSPEPYASLNLAFHVGDDAQLVRQNRAILEHGLDAHLVWMDQVHGSEVKDAQSAQLVGDSWSVGDADAIIVERSSIRPGSSQGAAVMVADCVPLILVDQTGARTAVVHVGRAGFEQGIAGKVVGEMCKRGTQRAQLHAFIGPSICGNCYELPAQMVEVFERTAPWAVSITSWGTPALDIPAGLEHQLRALELAQVVRHGACTLESHKYFSHRRAGKAGTSTGRFAGYAVLSRE